MLFQIIKQIYIKLDIISEKNFLFFENLEVNSNKKEKILESYQNFYKNLSISLMIFYFSDFKNFLEFEEEESITNNLCINLQFY